MDYYVEDPCWQRFTAISRGVMANHATPPDPSPGLPVSITTMTIGSAE